MSEESEWEKKVWGWTRKIAEADKTTSHELLVEEGGYCSFHLHEKRWNKFLVMSGEILVVELWGSTVKINRVIEGGNYEVPPHICHQFQVVRPGRVIEIYWNTNGSKPDVDDIERFTTGGMIWNESDLKLFGNILDENQNVLHLKWGVKQ